MLSVTVARMGSANAVVFLSSAVRAGQAFVERACADQTGALAGGRVCVAKRGAGFTIVLIIRQVVVEHQILDALLLSALGLLLRSHRDGKRGVGRQID